MSSALVSANNRIKAASVAAAAVIGLGTLLAWLRGRRQQRSKKLRRNMSFTSAYLTQGSSPAAAKVPEPIIHVCLYMDDCPTEDDLVELAVKPMLVHDRLSMIPCCDREGTLRMPNPPLDPHKLVRRIPVESIDQIYHTIQTKMFNEPLGDTGDNIENKRGDLPWWEFVLLENTGDGHSALLWRIHHALGDGISLAALMVRHVLKSSPDGAPLTSLSTFLPPAMMAQKNSSQEYHRTNLSWATRLWQLLDCAQQVFLLPLTPADDVTVFSQGCRPNRVHSGKREIVRFPTIPFKLVQGIKNAAQCTVNDVIFTLLSQSIHDYLEEQQCHVLEEKGTNLRCRALIPAALPRSVEDATEVDLLQNKWFFLSSDMGVGCTPSNDILERLQHIHNKFRRLKASPLAYVGINIQNRVLKYFPLSITQQGVHVGLSRHSMVVSNVPGPRQPVMIANREIKGAHLFLSNLIPHLMVVSYRGQVFASITIDPELVPNSQTLAKHYHQAVVSLAKRLDVPIPSDMK